MRKWFKYHFDYSANGIRRTSIDRNFEDHAKAMGYYNVDEAYTSKSAFFNKYFFDYSSGRLEHYDNFLRKHLTKEQEILSIASGRCANELFLMEDGYNIACSDLEVIDIYQETKRIFHNLDYIKLNILQNGASKQYDAVICLSLIYLFDENDLSTFFRNVSKGLKTLGCLILDSAGAPDNLLSFLIHDVYLRCESILRYILKSFFMRKCIGLTIQHFGYRKTDHDIIRIAKGCGFELLAKENYAFLVEFRRSILFNKIVKQGTYLEKFFIILGKNIPYIRMYNFRKIF